MATALNQLVSPEPRLAGGMMGPTEPTRSERELSNIEKIRGQLGLKREEQAVYKGEEAQFGAEQKAARAKELAKATGAERAAIEAAPAYTEAQQVERDVMEARFEPTQRSAQENMALMTAMNILGYFIGAGGKNRAQQAMAAFNGMLEGKNAGDVERFKQEKVKFDTNLKALKDRYSVLTSQLKRVADLAARDKDRAMQELDVVLAQNEADFIRQHINKQGLAATIKSLEDAEKGAVRVYEQAIREEDRARNVAEQKRRDAEQARLLEQLRQQGRIDVTTLQEIFRRGRPEKKPKPPSDVEKGIKSNAVFLDKIDDIISSGNKLVESGNIRGIGVVAGKVPYDAAQLYMSDDEKRFVQEFQDLSNQKLKDQSGATVTGSEFARARGVLPLRDDDPKTVLTKLNNWKRLVSQETGVFGKAFPDEVVKYGITLEVPSSKDKLVKGLVYRTSQGNLRWNGTAFEEVED